MPNGAGAGERILVTGANGSLGRQLLERLCREAAAARRNASSVRALVRSANAAAVIEQLGLHPAPEIAICDYRDEAAVAKAACGCRRVVHLVGILKQSRRASYEAAHAKTCEALARASKSAGVEHIVYLSILGSRPDSPNACLASKGRAEAILLAGPTPTTVLRVPMVIGPDDAASRALRAQARSRFVFLLGGGRTLQQPVDSRDVVAAILAALRQTDPAARVLDLAGPECLSHRDLLRRASALCGQRPPPIPISIPTAFGRATSWLMEQLLDEPPITRTMLDVLQRDDRIDPAPTCTALDLELRSLDETLGDHVAAGSSTR